MKVILYFHQIMLWEGTGYETVSFRINYKLSIYGLWWKMHYMSVCFCHF